LEDNLYLFSELVKSRFDTFSFLLPNLELPVEALDGHERVPYRGLHGNSKRALQPAKPDGNFFQSRFKIEGSG
jgi:hypothetical protein